MIYLILEYIKLSEFWKVVSRQLRQKSVGSQLSVEIELKSTEPFEAVTGGGWLCVIAIVSLFIYPYKFFFSLLCF